MVSPQKLAAKRHATYPDTVTHVEPFQIWTVRAHKRNASVCDARALVEIYDLFIK